MTAQGGSSTLRIDFSKKGSLILEAKQSRLPGKAKALMGQQSLPGLAEVSKALVKQHPREEVAHALCLMQFLSSPNLLAADVIVRTKSVAHDLTLELQATQEKVN